jgi:hypothetical protein
MYCIIVAQRGASVRHRKRWPRGAAAAKQGATTSSHPTPALRRAHKAKQQAPLLGRWPPCVWAKERFECLCHTPPPYRCWPLAWRTWRAVYHSTRRWPSKSDDGHPTGLCTLVRILHRGVAQNIDPASQYELLCVVTTSSSSKRCCSSSGGCPSWCTNACN